MASVWKPAALGSVRANISKVTTAGMAAVIASISGGLSNSGPVHC